jgi:bacterioferritin
MDFKATLQVSQMIVNELTEGAFVHKMQGLLFKSQGFEKLGQKYLDHYTEEMEWVEKYTNRMLDLGCVPEVKLNKESKLIEDAKAYIEEDLRIQREGVETLYKIMPTLSCDPTTYDITKAYLADEEEDLYWSEEQLDLIGKIGLQNWLMRQM